MADETVLVVEDEKAAQVLLRKTLEAEGYEVLSARSGVEALEMIENRHVDIQLLDMRMPDMHGLELLDELRTKKTMIPTILCTAMAKAGEAFEVRTYGVAAVLVKPVDLVELRRTVRRALDERTAPDAGSNSGNGDARLEHRGEQGDESGVDLTTQRNPDGE